MGISFQLNRKGIVALAVTVGVLAVVAGAWRYEQMDPAYSIVRFRTGDIYFGQLRWFPRPHLLNVWVLERGMDGDRPVTSVDQISKAPWKPLDVLYFNPSELATWSPLAADSPFVRIFSDPGAISAPRIEPGE